MKLILIYKIPSMKIEISIHDYSHDLFLFLFFISTKSKNQKATHFSHSGPRASRSPLLKLPSNERIPKKALFSSATLNPRRC